MAGKLITAAELIGFLTALLMIVFAKLAGAGTGAAVFVAMLTGLSLWVAFRVYQRPLRSEQVAVWGGLTTVCFGLVLSTTGLVIWGLGLERDQRFLMYLFFMFGVSVGIAAGVTAAYLQMARRR